MNWSADRADFKLITRIKNNFSVAYLQIWNFFTVLSLDSWILVLNGNHSRFFLSGTVNKVASPPQSGAGLAQGWQLSPFHREHRVPGDSQIQPHNQDGVVGSRQTSGRFYWLIWFFPSPTPIKNFDLILLNLISVDSHSAQSSKHFCLAKLR